MFKRLFGLHRWLGIAGGLMVLVWYASGLGIHWRALPRVLTSAEQRRAAGEPFALNEADRPFSEILASAGASPIREVRLRRAGSRLVYDVRGEDGATGIIDARTRLSLSPISDSLARDIASTFMPGETIRASVLMTEGDSFTSNLPVPLYRVTFADRQGTHVYVSARTASLVARARVPERLYYRFASIPHFLSFNTRFVKRHDNLRHVALYFLSAVAALIVGTGLSVLVSTIWRSGFREMIRRRRFPVRKWHYLAGLVFSVSTLLFIGSGFFLVAKGTAPPEAVLASAGELRAVLTALGQPPSTILPAAAVMGADPETRFVSVTLKSILGVPVYLFEDHAGRRDAVRADTKEPLAVDRAWARQVAEAFLGQSVAIGRMDLLTEYDSYYYARNNRVPPLPVYRVTCDDADKTVLYLSTATGEVIGRTDRSFRVRRWLVTALHTWDFPFLLNRPWLRNVVVVVQVGGGIAVSLTGLYLGGVHLVVRWRRKRESPPGLTE